ncbi:MAG: aminotransferase class III-fold pyridoxal phosphate-dependent enzyme [Rhodobacteraceae bacterium]|nr:aminotransferase class III-fold pyridoxal phosphate-dependent enzyme [Paracoccaceae bacterium]
MDRISTQSEWQQRARAVLPAGGFGNFDAGMIMDRGIGSRIWDMDGNEYVDYLIGSGPMLLGHGHPEVMEAVLEQLPKGQTFFANNTLGIELAEVICDAVPCAEQLRYVSTGGEADMYAIRLARAYTGREKIVKFEGGYHGMSAEAQMSLAPSKRVNFPQAVPDSAGIPADVGENVLVAPFNDPVYIQSLLSEFGNDVAAIIVEPLQRIIPPSPGFLELLRQECDRYGIVLIFDEVVTGFRFAYGGAQEYYGVTPDVTTLGKVIGGGFPLAAIVGRRDIMAHFDKSDVGADKWLMQLGVSQMIRDALGKTGVPFHIVGHPTLFEVVFHEIQPLDYRMVQNGDEQAGKAWNDTLRANGIFKSPGKTYPSLILSEEDLAITQAAIDKAAQAVAYLEAGQI